MHFHHFEIIDVLQKQEMYSLSRLATQIFFIYLRNPSKKQVCALHPHPIKS